MIKAVLFDFDGTLADTNPLIYRTFKETFEKMLPEKKFTDVEIYDCIGPTLDETGNKYFPEYPQKFVDNYRELNAIYHDEMIKIYPGVLEMVAQLKKKNLRLAIVSSKKRDFVIRGLKIVGLYEYFDFIVASDDVVKHKPDKEPLMKAINHYNITSNECLMVGDNSHDIHGARNTGVKSIAVGWALKGVEYMKSLEPDYLVHEASEILSIVDSFNKEKKMKKPEIIIAMDLPDKEAVKNFILKFPPEESLFLKVGMELYYKEGPAIIEYLKDKGHRIFLDLKMHDIPNTVRSAMRSIASLGIDLTNVHAAGGKKMMEAAVLGLLEGSPDGNRPQIIAVTQLTSTSTQMMNEEQGIPGEVADSALKWAKLTREAGLDGVVCSVHEARNIHEACGDDFIALTPGIRLEGDDAHDQTRVATPGFGKLEGSNYLVLGRSITGSVDPYEVYKRVLAEIE